MRCPLWLRGCLLDGVHEVVSRFCVPFMSLESPGCCSPSCSLPTSHTAYLSIPEVAEKKWVSLAASHAAEEAEHLLTYSHFPQCVKSQDERVSFVTVLCCLEEVIIIPLRLFTVSTNLRFAPIVCCNFSSTLLDFHKGSTLYCWLPNSVFFGGR